MDGSEGESVPSSQLMTSGVYHGSGACRRKRTQKERRVSPNLPLDDTSLGVYKVGQPEIAP